MHKFVILFMCITIRFVLRYADLRFYFLANKCSELCCKQMFWCLRPKLTYRKELKMNTCAHFFCDTHTNKPTLTQSERLLFHFFFRPVVKTTQRTHTSARKKKDEKKERNVIAIRLKQRSENASQQIVDILINRIAKLL